MATILPSFSLARGGRGYVVAAVQKALTQVSIGTPMHDELSQVTVDGIAGPQTMRAIARWLGKQGPYTIEDLTTFAPLALSVDLSGHNEGGNKGKVDTKKLASAVRRVRIKTTEDAVSADKAYYVHEGTKRLAAACLADGIEVGAYHFMRPDTVWKDGKRVAVDFKTDDPVASAHAEADIFWQVRGQMLSHKLWTLEDAGDGEKAVSPAPTAPSATQIAADQYNARWMLAWLRRVLEWQKKEGLCLNPLVYLPRWAHELFLQHADDEVLEAIGMFPLWGPSYNAGVAPKRFPDIWTHPRVWQVTGSGAVIGVVGKVDINIELLTP